MKLKITAMFYAAWMLISSVALCQTNAAAPEGNSLAALEASALDYLKDNPNRAIEIYNYYESTIKAEGWDELQPDLLYNQAIASYRAGKPGAAIGYLKQLNLVQPSSEISDQIHELQMLVEHDVYRQAPGTMFVRGESNEFAMWRMMQQFSEYRLHLALLIAWTCLFALVGARILKRRNRRLRLWIGASIVLAGFLVGMLGFIIYQKRTEQQLHFGVLTETDSLTTTPVNGTPITDMAFVPGITVRIVADTGEWSQVERFDGVRAWMASNDLYRLRPRHYQTMQAEN